MRRNLPFLQAILLVALPATSISCGPPDEIDLEPPRVVEVLPAGPVIETDATFSIRFSEPVARQRILEGEDLIVLIPANFVDAAFLSDIESPPLIDSRKARLVPSTIELDGDGTAATLTPDAPLLAGTRYALVVSADVRDTSGNPLVDLTGTKASFVYEIRTDAGPPQATSVSAVGTVPANLKRVRVFFNQPVNGVTVDTVRVEGTEGTTSPSSPTIEVASDRASANLILADGAGCERLTPLGSYAVVVDGDILDDAGRRVTGASFPFSVAAACDLTPNRITGAITAYGIAPDGFAFFSTSKASTTEVRFGVSGLALDCLGASCPALGEDARVAAAGVFNHSASFGGLADGLSYDVLVRAEDDVGSVALATTTLVVTPRPTVALNEILPNPLGEEDEGEFIELVNYGSEAVDVSDFSLQIGERAPCALGSDDKLTLEAGSYLVIARDTYVPSLYPEGDPTRVYSPPACGQTELLLANDVVPVRLFDALGRPVSIYAGYSGLSPASDANEGKSIERISPDAPDDEGSFCFSPGAPSPGRVNSSLALGCN